MPTTFDSSETFSNIDLACFENDSSHSSCLEITQPEKKLIFRNSFLWNNHCTTFLLATKVLTTKQLASINRHSSLCCNSQAARDGVRGLPIMSTVTPACWWCAMTDFLCPCQTWWRDAGCLSGWGPVGWRWLGGWWTNVGSIVDPCGWSGSEDL